jgi:hypothetical protein
LSLTVIAPDGHLVGETTSSTSTGGPSPGDPVQFDGVISGVLADGWAIDTCAPGDDACVSVAEVHVVAPSLSLDIPIGTFVRVAAHVEELDSSSSPCPTS